MKTFYKTISILAIFVAVFSLGQNVYALTYNVTENGAVRLYPSPDGTLDFTLYSHNFQNIGYEWSDDIARYNDWCCSGGISIYTFNINTEVAVITASSSFTGQLLLYSSKNISPPYGQWVGYVDNPDVTANYVWGYFIGEFINGVYQGEYLNFSTHFISFQPTPFATTSTTTTVGANLYANSSDFTNTSGKLYIHMWQDSAFACMNSGAVYDAIYTCGGENTPASPITLDFTDSLDKLIAGNYNLSTSVTFGGGGKWNATYEIQQAYRPWWGLYLYTSYKTLVSTTTWFIIGTSSPMDITRGLVQAENARLASSTINRVAGILASTTASLASSCGLGGFNLGDCLVLLIYPGDQAIADDFDILKQMPPWGYAFRVIDIFNATSSTTTLPSISYTFASTSPMAVIGNIHFDPFGMIAQSGTLINEMHSDQAGGLNVWDILMPFVRIFVYLVLGIMMIHDLTGIHAGDYSVSTGRMNKRKGVDESYQYKEKLYEMSQRK